MKKESENNGRHTVKRGKNCSNRQSNSLIKEGPAPLYLDTPRHHPQPPFHLPNHFQRFGQVQASIGQAEARSFSGLSARSGCQDGMDEDDAASKATKKARGGAKNAPIEETNFDQSD